MFFSSILSNTAYGYFRWLLNHSTPLSTIYVSDDGAYQSGSGMVTVELAVGDTVSLKSQRSNPYVHHFSCYTLIKIK